MKFSGFLFLIILISCQNQPSQKLNNKPLKPDFGAHNTNAPSEIMEFGRLVGIWDVISQDSVGGKGWQTSKGTWTWRYILDGFAIEDTWYESASDSTNHTLQMDRDFIGKNLRVYNPTKKTWNIAWVENQGFSMANFTAKADSDGNVVMYTSNGQAEITFHNITKSKFDWKYEILNPDGTKTIYSKMKATRRM